MEENNIRREIKKIIKKLDQVKIPETKGVKINDELESKINGQLLKDQINLEFI